MPLLCNFVNKKCRLDWIIQILTYLGIYSVVLVSTVIGEHVLRIPRESILQRYVIAFCDTTIHAIIGSVSWFLVVWLQLNELPDSRKHRPLAIGFDILLAGAISYVIDLDHVLAARSFDIRALTSLKSRPLFHNTLLMSSIIILLILCPYYFPFCGDCQVAQLVTLTARLGWVLVVGVWSHHLRDALRHGICFGWSCTRPLSPLHYYSFLLALPIVVSILANLQYSKPLDYFNYSNATRSMGMAMV